MARRLTVEEAAKKLGCHPETIRRAVRRKELLATRDPVGIGRPLQIDPMDLAAFIEKRKRA